MMKMAIFKERCKKIDDVYTDEDEGSRGVLPEKILERILGQIRNREAY